MAKALKKAPNIFECQHCGHQAIKWSGKCPNCGAWDSFVEVKAKDLAALRGQDSRGAGGASALAHSLAQDSRPILLNEVQAQVVEKFSANEPELDIVLGGGVVPGGLYLVGGSPGVGKSTLLLKTSANLAKTRKVLYVSGEESAAQIKLRAERLGDIEGELYLLAAIDLESIETALRGGGFSVCVIDSIQTMFSSEVTSAPGSVSQVKECTFLLLRLAKELQISIFIIGHITKDGAIAGPRILEHMVDCVLYFEGDPSRELRILRSFKNRFGATNEIGIFEMSASGLVSAKNTSQMFFSQRDALPGSAVSVVLEGTRPIVLEIQALVAESGFPRRSATGFELNRLNMLLALLERKIEIPLGRYDVFVNVVGGMKITETAADLALIAAIISSYKNRPINAKSAFIGEVSLVGDIREVSNIDLRLKELEGYGFSSVIAPQKPKNSDYRLKIFEAQDVTKILKWM